MGATLTVMVLLSLMRSLSFTYQSVAIIVACFVILLFACSFFLFLFSILPGWVSGALLYPVSIHKRRVFHLDTDELRILRSSFFVQRWEHCSTTGIPWCTFLPLLPSAPFPPLYFHLLSLRSLAFNNQRNRQVTAGTKTPESTKKKREEGRTPREKKWGKGRKENIWWK